MSENYALLFVVEYNSIFIDLLVEELKFKYSKATFAGVIFFTPMCDCLKKKVGLTFLSILLSYEYINKWHTPKCLIYMPQKSL